MYQFFVDPGQIQGTRITITGKDVNHIKNVLRLRNGEHIMVVGSDQNNYISSITEVNDDFVNVENMDIEEIDGGLSASSARYQCMTDTVNMEGIKQQSVVLGVDSVVPVMI